MLKITEIRDREKLFQIKERWDSILAKSHLQVPYFSFDWYYTALETIDKDKAPLLLFFDSSGKDIGLVPFVYKKQKILSFSYNQIGFVYNPYTPYQGFIYLDGFREIFTSLIHHLRKNFGTHFYIDLDEIRLTQEEDNAIRELTLQGLITFDREEKHGSRYLILNENIRIPVSRRRKAELINKLKIK